MVLYDNFYWTLARTCVWWLIRTSAWYVFLASEWSLFTPQHYNNSLLTLNLKITILSVFTPQYYSNSVCPRPGLVADLWSQWSLILWLHSYTNVQWYVVTYNQDTGQIDKFANLKRFVYRRKAWWIKVGKDCARKRLLRARLKKESFFIERTSLNWPITQSAVKLYCASCKRNFEDIRPEKKYWDCPRDQ